MASTIEHSQLIEIDAGHKVYAVTFTADGEYIVSGGSQGIGVWRVKEGRRVLMIPAERGVECVAASLKAGRCYIAAGSWNGKVKLIWTQAGTWTGVVTVWKSVALAGQCCIYDVDFSPDATRLVSADGYNGTATIWDVAACQKVRTLCHPNKLFYAAKYSPKGDRIATAARKSVQVWDSNKSWLLADIKLNAEPEHGLLWHNNHLLVKTNDSEIRKIGAPTGLTFSAWSVPLTENASCIAMSQNGTFIAYAAKDAITFWSTSTHTQLGLIPQTYNTSSLAFSPNHQFIAIAARNRTIIVKDLSFIKGPQIWIQGDALHAWKNGHLANAEALLTAEIPTSHDMAHHVLSSRALVRTRLQKWDAALVDAEESVEIQPSLVGYIAKYAAVIGKGDILEGSQVCDIASQYSHLEHTLFLLVKSVVLFMAGKHVDAISSIDGLITHKFSESAFYVVQAYMHLHIGDLHMESGNYERAVRSLEDAQTKLGNRTRPPPLIISLVSGWVFDGLAITIQQRLCEALLAAGRTKEAGEHVLHIHEINVKSWAADFKSRCCRKLEDCGDTAMNTERYDEAISHYTIALSLNPVTPQYLLVQRSKAHAENGSWKDALDDANKIIELDPSSPLGYERKHQALRGIGHDSDAVDAFETMLLKMSQSTDPIIREQSCHYVRPEETKKTIRASIENAIRDSPPMLINVISGRLCSKSEQAAAFESAPIFTELLSSMTTRIDHVRIEREVAGFYHYVALSHTWENNESLFEQVTKVVVYDLEASPANDGLRMFCTIVRELGFGWAWCDLCCVDKANPSVLQEALVSAFKWYECAVLTIVFLRGVYRLAKRGALTRSVWNTCEWALQEYCASKVVRFYTEDWTLYLGLDIYNHKEAPEITSEMEEATGIPARVLMALRPGLDGIREKLRLASTRQVTRIEDEAYSLFGLFSVSLPIEYGEGKKALGRLLVHLLAKSGETGILAWTGKSGSVNTCLPFSITVFAQPFTSHIPPAVADADAEVTTHVSIPNLALFTMLYDRLNRLPAPSFVGYRLKLPCLVFKLGRVSVVGSKSERVFRVQTNAFGVVEIKTEEDLSQLDSLYLIHPWLDFLLGRQPGASTTETIAEEGADDRVLVAGESLASDATSAARKTRTARLIGRLGKTFGGRSGPSTAAHPSPLTSSVDKQPTDKQVRVRQFVARLRRPFGPLLLAPTPRNAEEYKRVATESLITVQLQEMTSTVLEGLIHGVRVLDVV